MIKCSFKIFYPLTVMSLSSFACFCTRVINFIFTFFNAKHAIDYLNTMYQFEDIRRKFTRTRASKTDRKTLYINETSMLWPPQNFLQHKSTILTKCVISNFKIPCNRSRVTTITSILEKAE